MIEINVVGFVEEDELVTAVANHLGISHKESENMYVELGGYMGNGHVTFSTIWPDGDAFSVAVQEYMVANNIQTLRAGYED